MPEQRESVLITQILRELRSRGVWAYKTHGGPDVARGLPDIVGCYQGRFIGLEAKRKGQSPTVLQARTLKEIAAAGGISAVVRSVDEALHALALD